VDGNVLQTTWRERGTEKLKYAALGPGAFQARTRSLKIERTFVREKRHLATDSWRPKPCSTGVVVANDWLYLDDPDDYSDGAIFGCIKGKICTKACVYMYI
jgi:hypothetical protein